MSILPLVLLAVALITLALALYAGDSSNARALERAAAVVPSAPSGVTFAEGFANFGRSGCSGTCAGTSFSPASEPLVTPPEPAEPAPSADCPTCSWSCEGAPCPQDCRMNCDEPACRVECEETAPPSCTWKCEPPVCRVRCDKDGPCAKDDGSCTDRCRVECQPPRCKLHCTEAKVHCVNRCERPRCERVCTKPSDCEEPRCQLVCQDDPGHRLSWREVPCADGGGAAVV
jgi:hypothetical protein